MTPRGERERKDEIRYRVSPDDVIVSVEGAWDRFARENRARELVGTAVGTSLLEAVSGSEVRELLRAILGRVRDGGESVELPYRCDAPHARRFMRLRLDPEESGDVRFSSWIVREVPRETVALLDPEAARRDDDLLKICAWCKRVNTEGRWVEVEEAVEALNLFGAAPLPTLTHGVCEACRERVFAAV